jgi:hypothetical protein
MPRRISAVMRNHGYPAKYWYSLLPVCSWINCHQHWETALYFDSCLLTFACFSSARLNYHILEILLLAYFSRYR